jgi:hypothetical protein
MDGGSSKEHDTIHWHGCVASLLQKSMTVLKGRISVVARALYWYKLFESHESMYDGMTDVRDISSLKSIIFKGCPRAVIAAVRYS